MGLTLNDVAVRAIGRMLEPLRRRLRMIVQRAVVEYVHQQQGRPFVQVVATGGEPHDAEMVQPFGFASQPVPGAGAVVLNLCGDRAHAIAINVGDNRYRVDVAAGEVALYNQAGARIHLKSDRIIDIEADQLNINCKVVVGAELEVTGDATVSGDATIAGKSFLLHHHGVSGSTTTPPA